MVSSLLESPEPVFLVSRSFLLLASRERASLCGRIPLKTRDLSPPPSALGRGGNEEGHTCSLKGSASQRKSIASACVSWAGTQNSAHDHIPPQGRKDQGVRWESGGPGSSQVQPHLQRCLSGPLHMAGGASTAIHSFNKYLLSTRLCAGPV